jgi:rare lipoprotein A
MRMDGPGKLFVMTLALLALGACAKRAKIGVTPARGATEEGIASWYGHPYHGRATASGEIFDMNQFTAAHRRIAFGVWLEVRNLENGRTVDVRVNDRGPFVKNRVIDLSRAAAERIAMIGPGTARVRLKVIDPPRVAAAPARFGVQVAWFGERDAAERLRAELERRYPWPAVVRARPGGGWGVVVGRAPDATAARVLLEELRKQWTDAFPVALDE